MNKKIPNHHRIINAKALAGELTELAQKNGGNETQMREQVLDRLRQVTADARRHAEMLLMSGSNGVECAGLLSRFQDGLLKVLYQFTTEQVYRATNPSAAEKITIIAVGGYGRGLLAPGSDIDLLFLFPYKQTPWGESVVEYMLYILWDLGFKVGHATRNITQCIRLSQSDYTIRTSILEARFLWGDKALFNELMDRFDTEIVKKTAREFISAKLEERDERHKRSGESRYLVEPNLKEGKGGLRDLHTLYWIAKYFYQVRSEKELVKLGVLTKKEELRFRKCEAFLWTVRCHLHFLSGRAEERLSFEVQPQLAERLGYTERGHLSATERFMKHYFLIAKDIGDLTRIICAALETGKAKKTPGLSRFISSLTGSGRRITGVEGFVIQAGRINTDSGDVFERDPVNLIRIFYLADRHNVLLHPEAVRQITGSLKLIGRKFRHNKQANQLFLEILTSRNDPETILRKMNETGVLGRFIFNFGRIVSLMQFNMYHYYTVDEHLLRSIGVLSEIERGLLAEEHPLSNRIIHKIQHRRALFLAVFLHDVAKGRPEEHSVAGARIVRRLGPRLGLDKAETETAAWLVENHLLMSHIAQRRDLHDFRTIQKFSEIVQSPERLKLLLILTVADIKAVGPGVWNGWKGQLLRTLYHEAEPVMGGGYTTLSRKQRAGQARGLFAKELEDWPQSDVDRILNCHYEPYLLNVPLEKQVRHAELMREGEKAKAPVTTSIHMDAFQDVTELTVYTPDHPHLLSVITGACAASEASISGAQIFTTKDGFALDIITIYRRFDADADERRRAKRVTDMIEQALKGEVRLASILKSKNKRKSKKRAKTFSVEPQVIIDNDSSNIFTLIEINGLDRHGLLYELTEKLFKLSLNIGSAHIVTYGERVVDVFYVKDNFGHKIHHKARQDAIRSGLLEVLEGRAVS